MVGLDTTIVNVALPSIHTRAERVGVGAAVDDRRLHAGAGEPADARRLDGRPGRAPEDLPGRSGGVLARVAAVRAGAEPRLPDRRAGGAGDRRLDAQPGGDVDHPQRVRGPARAGDGDRCVGRRVRPQHGARASRRRRAGGFRQLARGVLRQRPDRACRDRAHGAVRARVPRAAPATARPGGAGARDRRAGEPHLLDHRGTPGRLDLRRVTDAVRGRGGVLRGARRVRAEAARAAAGNALLPQRAVLGRQRDRGRDVRRARGLPVPEHPVPPGRARALAVPRRPLHAADGRDALDLLADCRGGWSAATARGPRSSRGRPP